MNILQLISSEGYFGAENMLVHLSKALKQLGCMSVAGVFENSHRPNLEIVDEAHRQSIPVEIIPCNGRIDRSAIRKIRNCIRDCRIDIVHTHGYKSNLYGYMAASTLGVPLITTCHNWTRQSVAVRFYDLIDGFVVGRFDAVVGVSEPIIDRLLDLGVTGDKVHLISNGLDFSSFDEVSPAFRRQVPPGTLTIGSVCRMSKLKGLSYLIEAAQAVLSQYPEAHFLLVGDGPDRSRIEEMAIAKGIADRVTFAGLRRDIPDVYASLDIFVLSSIDEAMPMALLEALAAGKAIVATRVGDVSKLIHHEETGLLIEARDASGLAEAIIRLLEDQNLREKLGKEGQRFVHENYSAESMARQYLGLYESLFVKQKVA